MLLKANKLLQPLMDSAKKINLFLASLLVIGLVPHPEIADYFTESSDGIFGNTWMKEHFTAKTWHHIKSHIKIPAQDIARLLRRNCQDLDLWLVLM